MIILSLLFSCKQTAAPVKEEASSETILSGSEEEIDLQELREDYIRSYSEPVTFESGHSGRNGEDIRVIGKYYCLFDSSLIVPGKYNLDDTTRSFRTHQFAEEVTIIVNRDTTIRKTIEKQLFNHTLPKYLQDYAVLFEPQFEGYAPESGTFHFLFSVSIPLTDVGESRELIIHQDGTVQVRNVE